MNYRRDRYHKNIKNKRMILSIFSLILVLILSVFISSNLSKIIYKNTLRLNVVKETLTIDNGENVVKPVEEKISSVEKIPESNLVLFQGGVFLDLENAEDFKSKIQDKTLASIVNDGKHEKLFLGVSDSKNFSEMVSIFKKNNLQFVKQVYKIPNNLEYGSEIIEIVEKFSKFIIKNYENLFEESVDISDFKNEVEKLEPDYGNSGLHNEFVELKELILEFDDSVKKEELESIIDFIYTNLRDYNV